MPQPTAPGPRRVPTAFLGERADPLLARLREGHPPKRACALANCSFDTFSDWMSKGRAGTAPYAAFRERVLLAVADGSGKTPPGPVFGRRPNPIAPEAQDEIISGLRRGWSHAVAAKAAGVRLNTLVSWLRLGGHPRVRSPYRPVAPEFVAEPYRSFVRAVLAAEDARAVPAADAQVDPPA